jgi:hypothetical protein
LIAGLTILCSGDKSEKLSVAFDAFDVDRKGALNRHQSICYFRSFVSVLLSLTEGVRHHTTTTNNNTTTNNTTTTTTTTNNHNGGDVALSAQVTAVQVTEMLWDRLHLDPAQGVLPFDDFAEWYTEEGYAELQWLELLDRRKWPGQPTFEFALLGTNPLRHPLHGSHGSDHGSHGDHGDHQFVAARLRVYPEDVTCMYNVLACTGFQNLPCAHMHAVLAAVRKISVYCTCWWYSLCNFQYRQHYENTCSYNVEC